MNPLICCRKLLCLGHFDVNSDSGSNQMNESYSNSTSSSAITNSTKSLNCFAIATTSTVSSELESPSCFLYWSHTPY
jgi:hypothetical protein